MSANATRTSDGSERSGFNFERVFASKFYEAVASPLALSKSLQLVNNEFQDLCGFSCNPSNYQEPEHFAEDYQVAELLKQSLNIPGYDSDTREQAALQKFLSVEVHNAQTNDRLWNETLPDWFGEFSHQVLRILGPLDKKALDRVAELGKFGPGACVGVRSEGLVPSVKYEANPVATKPCAMLLPGFIPEMVRDYKQGSLPTQHIAWGNRHFTVPKRFDIDRCAATEPLWNSFIQLGAGYYMMERLKRFGVDLHSQELNQLLASKAQDWKLGTIHLSSASDMMARTLVVLALVYNGCEDGRRWLHLLNSIRSPIMDINGSKKPLEMFSSMGNGFTFPLETILFLALVRATVPRKDWTMCTAYGDDIIVPQRHAIQVVDRLGILGFRVNSKKTCLAGAFFESCGTDWFNGRNVRPFYLHQDPTSPIPYPLQAANALRAWCLRVYGYLPKRYYSLWKWCKRYVPQAFRSPIPSGLGDVGLHTSLSDALASGLVKRASADPEYGQCEGYLVRTAKFDTVSTDRKSFGVLAAALSSARGSWKEQRPFRGRLYTLRDFALTQRRIEDNPSIKGLEPMRGLFGKIRTEMALVFWNDEFNWE